MSSKIFAGLESSAREAIFRNDSDPPTRSQQLSSNSFGTEWPGLLGHFNNYLQPNSPKLGDRMNAKCLTGDISPSFFALDCPDSRKDPVTAAAGDEHGSRDGTVGFPLFCTESYGPNKTDQFSGAFEMPEPGEGLKRATMVNTDLLLGVDAEAPKPIPGTFHGGASDRPTVTSIAGQKSDCARTSIRMNGSSHVDVANKENIQPGSVSNFRYGTASGDRISARKPTGRLAWGPPERIPVSEDGVGASSPDVLGTDGKQLSGEIVKVASRGEKESPSDRGEPHISRATIFARTDIDGIRGLGVSNSVTSFSTSAAVRSPPPDTLPKTGNSSLSVLGAQIAPSSACEADKSARLYVPHRRPMMPTEESRPKTSQADKEIGWEGRAGTGRSMSLSGRLGAERASAVAVTEATGPGAESLKSGGAAKVAAYAGPGPAQLGSLSKARPAEHRLSTTAQYVAPPLASHQFSSAAPRLVSPPVVQPSRPEPAKPPPPVPPPTVCPTPESCGGVAKQPVPAYLGALSNAGPAANRFSTNVQYVAPTPTSRLLSPPAPHLVSLPAVQSSQPEPAVPPPSVRPPAVPSPPEICAGVATQLVPAHPGAISKAAPAVHRFGTTTPYVTPASRQFSSAAKHVTPPTAVQPCQLEPAIPTPPPPAPPPPVPPPSEVCAAVAKRPVQESLAAVQPGKPQKVLATVNGRQFVRLELIGRGGSSKVYKVMSPKNQIFALKVVKFGKTDPMPAVEGYINEINLLRRLAKSDRIIRLYDAEVNHAQGVLKMIMECGEIDFAQVLAKQQGRPASLHFVRLYWEQMLQAVQAIHEEKIVHSDLKPANFIFVEGSLKLIDFGIAKSIPNDTTNVQLDQQVGTVNYMSPEAILDTNSAFSGQPGQQKCMKLGRPSDVWSLGCILYQMIYGQTPFSHLKVYQRIQCIPDPTYKIVYPTHVSSNRATPPPTANATLPEGTPGAAPPALVPVDADAVGCIMRCLRHDPKKRATIPELLAEKFLRPAQSDSGAADSGARGGNAAASVRVDRATMNLLVREVCRWHSGGQLPDDSQVQEASQVILSQMLLGRNPDLRDLEKNPRRTRA